MFQNYIAANVDPICKNMEFQTLIQEPFNCTICTNKQISLTKFSNFLLQRKYDIVFNYFYAKPINELLADEVKPHVIQFKEYKYLDERSQEYLKKYYNSSDNIYRMKSLVYFYKTEFPQPMPNLTGLQKAFPVVLRNEKHEELYFMKDELQNLSNQNKVFCDSLNSQNNSKRVNIKKDHLPSRAPHNRQVLQRGGGSGDAGGGFSTQYNDENNNRVNTQHSNEISSDYFQNSRNKQQNGCQDSTGQAELQKFDQQMFNLQNSISQQRASVNQYGSFLKDLEKNLEPTSFESVAHDIYYPEYSSAENSVNSQKNMMAQNQQQYDYEFNMGDFVVQMNKQPEQQGNSDQDIQEYLKEQQKEMDQFLKYQQQQQQQQQQQLNFKTSQPFQKQYKDNVTKNLVLNTDWPKQQKDCQNNKIHEQLKQLQLQLHSIPAQHQSQQQSHQQGQICETPKNTFLILSQKNSINHNNDILMVNDFAVDKKHLAMKSDLSSTPNTLESTKKPQSSNFFENQIAQFNTQQINTQPNPQQQQQSLQQYVQCSSPLKKHQKSSNQSQGSYTNQINTNQFMIGEMAPKSYDYIMKILKKHNEKSNTQRSSGGDGVGTNRKLIKHSLQNDANKFLNINIDKAAGQQQQQIQQQRKVEKNHPNKSQDLNNKNIGTNLIQNQNTLNIWKIIDQQIRHLNNNNSGKKRDTNVSNPSTNIYKQFFNKKKQSLQLNYQHQNTDINKFKQEEESPNTKNGQLVAQQGVIKQQSTSNIQKNGASLQSSKGNSTSTPAYTSPKNKQFQKKLHQSQSTQINSFSPTNQQKNLNVNSTQLQKQGSQQSALTVMSLQQNSQQSLKIGMSNPNLENIQEIGKNNPTSTCQSPKGQPTLFSSKYPAVYYRTLNSGRLMSSVATNKTSTNSSMENKRITSDQLDSNRILSPKDIQSIGNQNYYSNHVAQQNKIQTGTAQQKHRKQYYIQTNLDQQQQNAINQVRNCLSQKAKLSTDFYQSGFFSNRSVKTQQDNLFVEGQNVEKYLNQVKAENNRGNNNPNIKMKTAEEEYPQPLNLKYDNYIDNQNRVSQQKDHGKKQGGKQTQRQQHQQHFKYNTIATSTIGSQQGATVQTLITNASNTNQMTLENEQKNVYDLKNLQSKISKLDLLQIKQKLSMQFKQSNTARRTLTKASNNSGGGGGAIKQSKKQQ